MYDQQNNVDIEAIQKVLGGKLIWVGMAFLCVMIFVFNLVRVEQVSGEEIGFLLNKISGEITVIPNSGAQIFNGLTKEFYVIDKTLQTMEMTATVGTGDRRGKDDLKIKTIDGSDVFVDLKIQYRIDPDMAEVILKTSGPGDLYKMKWARDYIRSICRNSLGELQTEEFYNASLRAGKVGQAKIEANRRLQPFGIRIDSIVIPRRPLFYAEYEAMIKRKKLADQAVLEEQSKANAAKQKQLTAIVIEGNKKKVAIEQFEGAMKQLTIAEEATSERVRKLADAYYEKETVAALAKLYQMEKLAKGTLAIKKADAEGIKKLNKALEGKGGENMVRLEYAKRLHDIKFTGQPFIVDGLTTRFEHLKAGQASGGVFRK